MPVQERQRGFVVLIRPFMVKLVIGAEPLEDESIIDLKELVARVTIDKANRHNRCSPWHAAVMLCGDAETVGIGEILGAEFSVEAVELHLVRLIIVLSMVDRGNPSLAATFVLK